jgi:hypothetical protein
MPRWSKPTMRLSLWCAVVSVLACFTHAQAQESLIVALGDSNTAGAGSTPQKRTRLNWSTCSDRGGTP